MNDSTASEAVPRRKKREEEKKRRPKKGEKRGKEEEEWKRRKAASHAPANAQHFVPTSNFLRNSRLPLSMSWTAVRL